MRKISKTTVVVLTMAIMSLFLCACSAKNNEQANSNAIATEQKEDETVQDAATNDASAEEEQQQAESGTDKESSKLSEVTIVYTNDIHSYIDNVTKDSDGNVTGDGLRFSKIAAMVEDMRADGKNVLLVDAGDEIQGDVYGAMDEGETIIQLMNATGYDLATPGNHDFDYGVISFLKLNEIANYPYVSCNFHSVLTKDVVFPSYRIFEFDGTRVALVGITTPETITSSTPTYFKNENNEFIYAIDGCDGAQSLYDSVQNAVDNIGDKADYIIALGHIGVGMDEENAKISSKDIIANVSGLDAFIDGHSHTTMEGDYIKDKDGKDVLLTQTGSYLNAFGVMTIGEDGKISSKLVNDYDREDEKVAEIEKAYIENVNNQLGEKIADLDFTLYINNPDNNNQRLIRSTELNLGDFTADSIYWFFNGRLDLDCDIAIANGGGIREQVEKGDFSYLSAKSVEPFGNMICLISATGQQILDCLEMGATDIGIWDSQWDSPAENGGFMQVAGLSYTIDASIPSNVETDGNGMFVAVNGDYRVKDVAVYNKENGKYEPIDLKKEYQLAAINYILRNDGNGLCMFDSDELTVDYVGQDYVILAEYVKSFGKEGEISNISTANSPLSKYSGYLIDYENPYGAGRINIINVNYDK